MYIYYIYIWEKFVIFSLVVILLWNCGYEFMLVGVFMCVKLIVVFL